MGLLTSTVKDEAATPDEQKAAYVASLLREREGYIARGQGDRVSAVEAELERIGIERAEEPKGPRGRATK